MKRNLAIPNDLEDFSNGFDRLSVKNYIWIPMELTEFPMNYKQMADTYRYSEAKVIQRLPIYLMGMVRSVFMNMTA